MLTSLSRPRDLTKILVRFTGGEWSEEAIALLLSFKGFILQAQVAGYTEYGTPEVFLFACLSANVSFIYLFSINKTNIFGLQPKKIIDCDVHIILRNPFVFDKK